LPLAQTTSAAEEERREAIALLEEEILPPAVVKDNNEQAFAAVLDSLMEDFSSSDDEDDETPALKAVVLLNEPTEDSVPAEFQNTLEHHEPFEVVGFYAQQATVEPSTASERREANGDDELSPSSGEITSENESDNPFDEITSFHQLLKVTTPNTPTDFLLLGTFFLKQTEQTNAFSLRQLNQLLSSASKPNANHTVLELALSNHFITMVPDLTGLATATQYQLSKRGEASALRLFQAVTLQTQTA
jgi:hypothetical protein